MCEMMISECVAAPFPHAYWVIPGKFMAGGYPGGDAPETTIHNLQALYNAGIRHIVNLVRSEEFACGLKRLCRYEDQLSAMVSSNGFSLAMDQMPVKDTWIPTRPEMGKILDRIDDCLDNGKPVYVHCWGGIGRTGTVVGCFLIRHGFAADNDVIRRIQKLRKCTENSDISSPETASQLDMVRSWVRWE